MHINIKATNIKLTPEISEYIGKRLQTLDTLVAKDDTTVMCDIEVGRTTKHHQKGNVFRAEIQVSIKGDRFRAVAEKETLYDAIDTAKNEAARELRRHKQKQSRLFKKGGAKLKDIMRGFRR